MSAYADKYDRMLRLADVFASAGQEMRALARLGAEILHDEGVTDSGELSKTTYDEAVDDITTATTGTRGLLTRSLELDADALAVRATVLTYCWIDDLQEAAFRTLGSIAGRAIGYLAPRVELGGAVVSAGLIETEALDRDAIADYLDELAQASPDLMDHVTSGGGGLVEALQLRSLLASRLLAGDRGRSAAAAGLRAIGVEPFSALTTAAVRDVAGPVVADEPEPTPTALAAPGPSSAPRTLEELMTTLSHTAKVTVHGVGDGRFIAYLPGPDGGANRTRRLRLVGADPSSYAARAVAAIEAAVEAAADDSPGSATVMLVGSAQGGVAAAEIAAAAGTAGFTVDQVVTAGAPAALVPLLPEGTRMLSLEDRSDPRTLLGSLVNADARNRVVVVFDGAHPTDEPAYVVGGRAADRAGHPDLRAEIGRIQELGYLAG